MDRDLTDWKWTGIYSQLPFPPFADLVGLADLADLQGFVCELRGFCFKSLIKEGRFSPSQLK